MDLWPAWNIQDRLEVALDAGKGVRLTKDEVAVAHAALDCFIKQMQVVMEREEPTGQDLYFGAGR